MSSDDSQQQGGWGECSLLTCPIEWSIFQYQPNLVANALFIAIFGASMLVHLYQGYRWKQWTFASLVALGCASEMIGYGGRIIMHADPWSFDGFMLQISEIDPFPLCNSCLCGKRNCRLTVARRPVCITFAPVFMSAAIYITLYKRYVESNQTPHRPLTLQTESQRLTSSHHSIMRLSPSSAQFKPALYYQLFIPLDSLCLIIQAVGGALSTQSNGSSATGVNLGLAGLSLQVAVLFAFIALSVQYAFRYARDFRAGRASGEGLDARFKVFATFVSLAVLVIFTRCVFRIYELSEGYEGEAFHDEAAFIGLESV
jgi:hypothetical protein